MPTKDLVEIKIDIVKWALTEAEVDAEVFINEDNKWKTLYSEGKATLSTLKDFARKVKLPFPFLFLESVPSENRFSAQFRTIKNKKNDFLSHNLKDVILDMEYKKNWLSEYRQSNGFTKLNFPELLKNKNNEKEIIQVVRNFLELQKEWYKNYSDATEIFAYLKKKIESKGPVILCSGIVGSNTRRTLNLDEFRGFVLTDDYAPLIFINALDSYQAKNFTLLHELIHLFLKEEPDIVDQKNDVSMDEILINECVAEILMPNEEVASHTNGKVASKQRVFEMSKIFRVSVQSMAIKLHKLGYISYNLYRDIYEETMSRATTRQTINGGNFWNNARSHLGVVFSSTVIEAVHSNKITYTEGCKLFGMGLGTFDTYSQFFSRRN